jgi:hypothetical protein
MRVTRHHSCWVSPFGNPRIHARLTAPRGISQPPTSFIGSRCQGIHHAPLETYIRTQKPKEKLHISTDTAPLQATHPFRCSQPLSSNQTPHPTTKMEGQPLNTSRVLSQGPIVCLAIHLLLCTRPPPTTGENPSRLTSHQLGCFSWCSLERR